MTREFVSKRTRNEFREFLVGWTLREIEIEFEGANIECDRNFRSDVSGQRRSLVEQFYCTLDFGRPADVKRLLAAYQSIIERVEMNLPTMQGHERVERGVEQLKACLARDGFAYDGGKITAASPKTRVVFEQPQAISEITRRAIFDELSVGQISWCGRLSETDFLARLYDLDKLPSHDGRFNSMAGDIWQHRENNLDWDTDWVFSDSRLDLMGGPDDALTRFLCEMVHPTVRPNSKEAKALVMAFNEHLSVDGWELVEAGRISGRPTFVARCRATGDVALPEPLHAKDILSDDYVRELARKCDSKFATQDYDGAITNARTMLEAVLVELEKQLVGAPGDYKGDLPKQFKAVARQLRIDDERADLDDNFKQVARGLVQVVNGLAPIRNKMSDGHARERKPEAHHARVIVNAAKTVATFLVESYLVQRERGLLSASSKLESAR